MPEAPRLVLSCEHGGNRVPGRYRGLFAGAAPVLASHRGWDPGALKLAEHLSRRFGAPLHASRVTRLLVELNRSPGHPRVFSEYSRVLGLDERRRLLARHYLPHREALRAAVDEQVRSGRRVLHLAVHTFTPVLGAEVRRADVGLLYDPGRPGEVELSRRWQRALRAREPGLRVRRNYPYRGTADGVTTWLRREFPADRYLGVELEVNQRFPAAGGAEWGRLRERVADALRDALAKTGREARGRREDEA